MKADFLFLSGVLVMALSACSSEKINEPAASSLTPVRIGTLHQVERTETVSVSGTTASPDAPANISFLVSGKVILVGPREGDSVRKGQLLASVDPADYRLALASAAAQADVARVAFERAEDEHRRMKMLYDSKSLAPNDYQKFRAAFESARQQMEQAVASEKLSRKHLADATLYAPVTGFIAKRSIEPGEMASPGRPVFEIVKLDTVEVSVGVPETDVHLVRAGQKAEITLPALPGRSFMGTVRLVNVSADPGTRTFMTRISVPNRKHELRIGMVAEVHISGDRTVKVPTVPIEAIIRDPQGATIVYVYYPAQRRAYAKRVETGPMYGKEIEIKQGLTGDESIILAGQGRLRDGASVSVTTVEEAPGKKSAAPEKGAR